MRCALALTSLLFAACAEPVLLGSECVTAGGACEQFKPPQGSEGVDGGGRSPEDVIDGGEEPPAATLDSSVEDPPPGETPPRDSGVRPTRDAAIFVPPRDAARPPPVPADAGPPSFPGFFNPSFELVDGGREGEVAEFNPQAPVESPIAPWHNCRPGTTVVSSANYGLPPRPITPRDGNTFITDTFPFFAINPNGISQELMEPLVTGKRYAFAVDVYAQLDIIVNLKDLVVEVMATDAAGCVGRTLAFTQPIPPGSWQTRCIDFIATESPLALQRGPIRNLMLMASAPGDFLNFTAVLHIDNIRPYTAALCETTAGVP